MIDAVEALILDLLEWLAGRERTYAEVMEAWRTSCPKLPVWEDANDRGLITMEHVSGASIVRITSSGRAFLTRTVRLRVLSPTKGVSKRWGSLCSIESARRQRVRQPPRSALSARIEMTGVDQCDQLMAHQVAGAPGSFDSSSQIHNNRDSPEPATRRCSRADRDRPRIRKASGAATSAHRSGSSAGRAADGPPEAIQAHLVAAENLDLLANRQSCQTDRLAAHHFLLLSSRALLRSRARVGSGSAAVPLLHESWPVQSTLRTFALRRAVPGRERP